MLGIHFSPGEDTSSDFSVRCQASSRLGGCAGPQRIGNLSGPLRPVSGYPQYALIPNGSTRGSGEMQGITEHAWRTK